jgi:hypothetical protein
MVSKIIYIAPFLFQKRGVGGELEKERGNNEINQLSYRPSLFQKRGGGGKLNKPRRGEIL